MDACPSLSPSLSCLLQSSCPTLKASYSYSQNPAQMSPTTISTVCEFPDPSAPFYPLKPTCPDWYDNEHAPARTKVPGITSAARYKALDGDAPTYLALYDLDNISILTSPPYTSLRESASSNEKSIMQRSGSIQRRAYTLISSVGDGPKEGPASPWIIIVEAEFKDTEEAKKEIDKFYDDEHIPMHTKVPGFIRARRWKLDSWTELANGDKEPSAAPRKFITVYEMAIDSKVYVASKEHQELINTPWMKESTEKWVVSKKARQYELWKNFM